MTRFFPKVNVVMKGGGFFVDVGGDASFCHVGIKVFSCANKFLSCKPPDTGGQFV